MPNARIAGIGHHVPSNVVTNADLMRHMDTTDEWIQERTGIQERRYVTRGEETSTTLAAEAARMAAKDAGIELDEIDFIIFATLSPDYYFPGNGVLLQRELGISKTEIGALDIRNQCSGFVYALSVGTAFIQNGTYKNILVVGAEVHSPGLDFTTRGRSITVIFGDGAGAVILQPTEEEGIMANKLHSDGTYAERLAYFNPGGHGGYHLRTIEGYEHFNVDYETEDNEFGQMWLNQAMVDEGKIFPHMEGQAVFKMAVRKFPEVIMEAFAATPYELSDLDMFIPHQANLRISQFVQRTMRLPDDKVFNNIQKYGNTTAASIPLALSEAVQAGKVKRGDLVCLAAFGSGFTWAASVFRY